MAQISLILLVAGASFLLGVHSQGHGHNIDAVSPCSLKRSYGSCNQKIRTYYFNQERQQCRLFHFSGCGGNSNNFETREDCEDRCLAPVTTGMARCSLPLVKGPCEAFSKVYGYQGGKCIEFTYGGCEGNSNRFSTEHECHKACDHSDRDNICSLPEDSGPCDMESQQYYYNKDSERCESFTYGGCGGNRNRFESTHACEEKCGNSEPVAEPEPVDICTLPKFTGPCRANFPKYYYNKETNECELFTYGGCSGNGNNFDTKEQCESSCQKNLDVCEQPLKSGHCSSRIPRWGFKDGECTRFTYSGCDGNENRFSFKSQCEDKCAPKPVDPCSQPKKEGTCKANIRRWYYSQTTGTCSVFYFTGCNGNENNFRSKKECKSTCDDNVSTPSGKPTRCLERYRDVFNREQGYTACSYKVTFVWSYNQRRDRCQYGVSLGCGSRNAFSSKDVCEQVCRS